MVVAHLPLFLICGSQGITYALSQAGLYGQLPQKRLWVGSWEQLQPYSHNRLGSSTVTCAHKILQAGHLSLHHSRLPGEQEEPGALGGPSPKPV